MKLCPTCKTKYPDDANFCPQESCATADGPQRLQAAPEEAKPRFERGERLGGGDTGEVWRARDADNGRDVAYKLVAPEALPSAAIAARAEREWKQLVRVQSPHIATVIDAGRTPDGGLFVAMELVAGESLERVLRAGPMPLDRAKRIVAQIGQALLDAQKAGIVHRDLAPKNVLLTAAGEAKLINFPLGRPLSESVAGVPGYLSPEQGAGKPVDQRSNTYSLACVLYHMLTGEPPFVAATPEAVLEMHAQSPPLPASQRRPEASLSPEADRAILKALDKNSSRRHLTLRLFLSDVDSLVVAAPESAAGKDVGFAKTMVFGGGQAEVASLVAKAVAARAAAASAIETAPTETNPPVLEPAPRAAPEAPAARVEAAVAPAVLAQAATVAEVRPTSGNGRKSTSQGGPPMRLTPPPVTPTPAASKPGVKSSFRETLWFKKGDVEQMVSEAKAKLAASGKDAEGLPEDMRPIEDRYIDDGTLTVDDRKKFSLRTGGTSTAVPSARGHVPGQAMNEQEIIREMGGARRNMILIVVAIVVVALIVVALATGGGKGEAPKSEVPRAPSPVAARPNPAPPPVAAAAPAPLPVAPPAPAVVPAAAPRPATSPPPAAAARSGSPPAASKAVKKKPAPRGKRALASGKRRR